MRGAQILQGITTGAQVNSTIDWANYDVPGRQGVKIYPLYNNEDTGPHGPSAALVRYMPGAKVTPHLHPGYELIYVLEGTLSNDEGDHGPGTLQVCPPGSVHGLSSEQGCTFLVVWEEPVKVLHEDGTVGVSHVESH